MRWLWFVLSLLCFAVAFRTHSMGLAVLSLLAGLGLVLMGTVAVASGRIESRGRDATAMLSPEDLRLMRANVSEHIQVKAAGGVRTLPALLDVIDAGVTRCGATATATILDDFKRMKEGEPLAASKSESGSGTY